MKGQLSQYKWHIALFLVIGILVGYTIATGVTAIGLAKGGKPGKPEEPVAQCSDGLDNDGDGYCDFAWKKAECTDGSIVGDAGCATKDDNDETNCGDGVCEGTETCNDCVSDCGSCVSCGDGSCNGDETCATCEADCGACPPVCGDSICEGDETCATCEADCGSCIYCGDGSCNGNETCATCEADCGSCEYCGDGSCNGDETCATCEADCGVCEYCGDGSCNGDETCSSCEQDCGACESCTDSDNGVNYYIKGFVSTASETYWDYCSGSAIVEYYCEGTSAKTSWWDCGTFVCQDGVCVEGPGGNETNST